MAFENLDADDELDDLGDEEGGEPSGESNNRLFIIIAGVLGAIALFAVVCIVIYLVVLLPRSRDAQAMQKATVDAQNTEVASIIVGTSTAAAQAAIIAAYTPTPTITPIPPTFTPTSTATSVVAMPSETATPGASETVSAELATATALHATLTANAALYAATLTARVTQPTSIPNTGFADDVGLPMMMGLAVLLIVIVFLARRLRTT